MKEIIYKLLPLFQMRQFIFSVYVFSRQFFLKSLLKMFDRS